MAREFIMARLAKLHRSRNNRLVAGVLGGIAEYVGWSPTNVRILFWVIIILSAFVTLPMAMVAYGIMWVLMPDATQNSYINCQNTGRLES